MNTEHFHKTLSKQRQASLLVHAKSRWQACAEKFEINDCPSESKKSLKNQIFPLKKQVVSFVC